MRVLNLGCGNEKFNFHEARVATEIVGVDLHATGSVDIVHDLNIVPYPFPDSRFDLIILQDVLEHLTDVPQTLAEVHRICAEGGEIRIRTPHYSSYYAYGDPTHRHYFSSLAFQSFYAPTGNIYAPHARFSLRHLTILFPRIWRLTGVAGLANRYPERWEQLFSFMFRAENLEISLRVCKSDVAGTAPRPA